MAHKRNAWEPVTPSGWESKILEWERRQSRQFSPHRKRLIDRARVKALVCEEEGKNSPAEKLFRKSAKEAGWKVMKRGWPDFACTRNGEIVFVEVKDGKDCVRETQAEILNLLAGLGLKCFTWRPDTGFSPWR